MPLTSALQLAALLAAELLANALHATLAEGAIEEEELTAYERARNEAVRPAYEGTCKSASFEPPSEQVLRLRSALVGDQAAIDRYCGITFGTVAASEFYAPDQLARYLGRASLVSTS